MDDLFQQLETRIRALLDRCNQLEHTNLDLTQNQSSLAREKEALFVKNKEAISLIENMVTRLKSIESA